MATRSTVRNGRAKAGKRPRRGSAAAILRHVGTWQGDPGEMDRLLGELRRTKEAEVAAKKALLASNAVQRPAPGGAAATPRKRRP